MAIRFYCKSDTHREFSNFAPFGIDFDDAQERSRDATGLDQVKDQITYRAVRRKFELHAELKAVLRATGNDELIESAPTDYWGVGRDGAGQSKLGKLIERIRDELRQ
jgi:ribA/ribD-fused uncharacterized protein